MERLCLGIDIGSTTVKLVVLDENNEIIFGDYRRHHAHTQQTLNGGDGVFLEFLCQILIVFDLIDGIGDHLLDIHELLLDDLSDLSVLFDALDTVQAACLGSIALGDGDDLTVGGLQTETELTGLVLVHFKLGMGQDLEAFLGLVFNTGDGGILLDRGDTAAAGSFGCVDLRSGDDLTVGGLQIELNAGRNSANDKFTHSNHLSPRNVV